MADIRITAKKILKHEGGFQQWKNDKGNYYNGVLIGTNKGVTPAAYREVFGKVPTVSELKTLTDEQYIQVLRKKYWDKWKADNIDSQQLADILVDWVYNSGVWGIKIPQRILGVVDDGIVGPKTLEALNNVCVKEFHEKVWKEREQFFRNIVRRDPTQKGFLKGWLNRLNDYRWENK